MRMLEKDPGARIRAAEAMNQGFLRYNEEDEVDELHISTDDDPNLQSRLEQMNHQRIDIKKLKTPRDLGMQSPLTPVLTPCTQDLKENQEESQLNDLKLVMRTPVITGRIVALESSPQLQTLSPFIQQDELASELENDQLVLNKYANKSKK